MGGVEKLHLSFAISKLSEVHRSDSAAQAREEKGIVKFQRIFFTVGVVKNPTGKMTLNHEFSL